MTDLRLTIGSDWNNFALHLDEAVLGIEFNYAGQLFWRCAPVNVRGCRSCETYEEHPTYALSNAGSALPFLEQRLNAHYGVFETAMLAREVQAWSLRLESDFKRDITMGGLMAHVRAWERYPTQLEVSESFAAKQCGKLEELVYG